METEKEVHDLKLTVHVKATGGIHAAKAVLEAAGKALNAASCEVVGIGEAALVVESAHVSEKKTRKKDFAGKLADASKIKAEEAHK